MASLVVDAAILGSNLMSTSSRFQLSNRITREEEACEERKCWERYQLER